MDKVSITIIGAGAVGLTVAYILSKQNSDIVIIDRNSTFGQETSSRNSEVIHAGFYYPENSLKAKLCIRGKLLLYEFLKEYSINYKKCGKYVVAIDNDESEELHRLKKQGALNGVDDLKFISEINNIEDLEKVNCVEVLYSPSTGVFNTHEYMKKLEMLSINNGIMFGYKSNVTSIQKSENAYIIEVEEDKGNKYQYISEKIINCAGLGAENISNIAGINTEEIGCKVYYAKGEYFNLPAKYSKHHNSLIYPAVKKNSKSLGIHLVIDLQSMLKLGPNIFYIDNINYEVNEAHKNEFFNAAKRYLSYLNINDLSPDMSGIRPKLQGPGDTFRDFYISEESERGYNGFINLLGIDSPGLTSSLAIAEYIKNNWF